jgi:nucleoside-diphosphate-sugar epimerase
MQVTVLGATGGIGSVVVDAFLAAGHRVVALARDPARVPPRDGLVVVRGDVRDEAALAAALDGSEVVFHGVNLPYPEWDPGMVELTERIAAAAEARGLTLLFPGNVYGLGPDFSAPLAEDAPRQAPTAKGALRNRLEERLRVASTRGARVVIVRAGDFFGVPGRSTWAAHLVDKALTGGPIAYPTRHDVLHAWAYGPDLARVFVALAERPDALGRFEVLHFEGHTVDGAAWIAAVRGALADPGRRVKAVPWWSMRLLALVNRDLRELVAMRYLWDQPVRLRGDRLRAVLGEVPHTPLPEAVAHALRLAA